jgi:putative transposase
MAIKKDTLDQLLEGRDPQAVFSKDGLFDELKKALAERVLNAELDDHLENEAAEGRANRRNGHSKKTVLTTMAGYFRPQGPAAKASSAAMPASASLAR